MSELALIKEQTLTNIGDAIREKTSTTDLIMPKDMPAKIRSISSGSGVDLNSLRNKQYRIIVDQANMHNQYIEYKLDTGGIDTFPHKSTDSADHLYENNGLIKFIIDLKPMEGYNVGSVKIHCDTDMFYDENFNGSYTFYEYLIAGDIHITEVTPATKATGIDFSYYINKWYGSNAYNTTELTDTTKSILTNPAIKAINDTSANPTMESMFAGAGSLVSIPKIVVDTSDVVSLTRMFDGCGALEKVDISGINTSKVERINSIISSCNALKSFDLSFMSTVSMTDFGGIATYCNNLEVLDFSGTFIIDPSKLVSYDSIINNCPNLKYIIFNQENIALLTNNNFTSSFSSFGNTDTLTILIPGDQAKLDSIKSQIDQSQYSTYHIEIDLISNYTITKPGDGTVDVKKNEIVSEWKETKQDEDFKYFHIPKDNTGLTNKIIKFKVSGSGKWGITPVTFTDLELPVCVKYINEGIGIDIITTNIKMRDFADDCSTETQMAAPRLFGELKKTDYDDAHGFIFISESEGNPIDYAVYNITNNTDMILSRVKCRSGNESWHISGLASQVQLQTELTVTKLEYKVIEASDIKPTDYKLNFD